MRAAGVALLAVMLCSATLHAREDKPRHARANPGAVVAAEIAFSRMAQDKGQWTAFRATAAEGAKMFAPQPVLVAEFLKDHKDPPVAVRWQAHKVWASCDGAYAITQGAWQGGQATGYFITIWQRQPDGSFKWVLDHGDTLATPLAEPDMITARVADCDGPAPASSATPAAVADNQGKPERRRKRRAAPAAPAIDPINAASPDGSLAWSTRVTPDGARDFAVTFRSEGAMREVLAVSVKAPAA